MTWTRTRIDAIWRDLQSPRERPVKLLRARFRAGVDLGAIAPDLADDVAELFVLWGVLQVKEAWLMERFERRTWLGEARTLFGDAARAASSDEVGRMARFDGAVADLLLGLTPQACGGVLMMSGFVVVDAAASTAPHGLDADHFVGDLRRACDDLTALGEDARALRSTIAGLLGLHAITCKVHERLAWLRLAETADDAVIAAASRALRADLERLSMWTRRFGRASAAVGDVLPIDVTPDALVRLPSRARALVARWNERPPPAPDGPYRSS